MAKNEVIPTRCFLFVCLFSFETLLFGTGWSRVCDNEYMPPHSVLQCWAQTQGFVHTKQAFYQLRAISLAPWATGLFFLGDGTQASEYWMCALWHAGSALPDSDFYSLRKVFIVKASEIGGPHIYQMPSLWEALFKAHHTVSFQVITKVLWSVIIPTIRMRCWGSQGWVARPSEKSWLWGGRDVTQAAFLALSAVLKAYGSTVRVSISKLTRVEKARVKGHEGTTVMRMGTMVCPLYLTLTH